MRRIVIVLSLCIAPAVLAQQSPSVYRITHTYVLGGDGGWDYVIPDPPQHRLFSGCRSGVMAVSDYGAGKVVTTLPIGDGVDGAAFDPATGDAFASNADGTLTVIHQDTADAYHVVENVKTAQGARNMGLDPTTHRVFVVTARFGPAPAEATPANPRRRPPVLPGSFIVMVVERGGNAR